VDDNTGVKKRLQKKCRNRPLHNALISLGPSLSTKLAFSLGPENTVGDIPITRQHGSMQ